MVGAEKFQNDKILNASKDYDRLKKFDLVCTVFDVS